MTTRLSNTASALALAVALTASAASAATPAKIEQASALQAAVRDNDHETLKALIKRGVNVNAVLPDSTTPLFVAIDHQDVDSVRQLIAAGARADVVDQDGNSPLALACLLGDADIITSLLDARADPTKLAQGGVPPFALCAGSTSPAVLERLLKGGQAVDQASAAGQTALMYAAAQGKADNIAMLLSHGAQVNAKSKVTGYTPIMFAMRGGSIEAVQALIKGGADVSHVTDDGATALQIALEDKNSPFAVLLINSGASLKGNWDVHGRTPLQVAVFARNPELVKLMIAKGADPNEPSRLSHIVNPTDITFHPPPGDRRFQKRTPVDVKALGYTPRIMVHTNPDGGGGSGPAAPPTVALMLAASSGQAEVMKALVEGGADTKFVAADGTNFLLAAAGSRKFDAVKYAAQINPDLNVTRKDGSNALHSAVGAGGRGGGGAGLVATTPEEAFQVVKFLVDSGVSVDAKTTNGQTALAAALDRGDEMTQALFKKIVADRDAKANPVKRASNDAKPAAPKL
jgi:uncharacterized protein